MYTKSVPFRNFKGKPANQVVNFNLTEREVFKLLPQLQAIFEWKETLKGRGTADLPTEEVIEYYNNFETVLLEAWGEPSEDGMYFNKGGRFEFEESALFAATMLMFVTDPEETSKLLEGIMPKGLESVIDKATKNLADFDKKLESLGTSDETQVHVDSLKAKIAELEAQKAALSPS